jgi:hypothetical protein
MLSSSLRPADRRAQACQLAQPGIRLTTPETQEALRAGRHSVDASRPPASADPPPDAPARGYWSWFGFWAQFVVLGLLAILGAGFASQGGEPGDYACGLILSIAAVVLAFMRLKHNFDGGPADWRSFVLVDDMANLWAVIVVFVIVALAGLFLAAGWEAGSLHDAGIALFAASGLAVFLSLKHVFDTLDRRP